MLKKLLKYDLKYIYKILLLLYSLTIICAIGARLFSFGREGSLLLNILNIVFIVLTFFMIAATLMYNLIRLWGRFKNSVYGDESYLTHTLPVTKKDIYLSKISTAIITVTASILVSFISIYIMNGITYAYGIRYQSFEVVVNSSDMTEEEKQMIMQKNIEENQQLAIQGYKESIFIDFMNWVSILIFSIWVSLTGYFAIIAGNNTDKDKRTESIILGTSLFFLCICLNYLLLASFTFFGKDSFASGEINIIIITYYSFISILYYIFGMKQLKNGINVA